MPVRRLLPDPVDLVDVVDLVDAYGYPPNTTWLRANMIASADGAATINAERAVSETRPTSRYWDCCARLADVVIAGAGTVTAEGYGPAPRAPRAPAVSRCSRSAAGAQNGRRVATAATRLRVEVLHRGIATARGRDV